MESPKLSQNDRVVLYGYGLFETILVVGKEAKFLPLHWSRMKNGAELLGLYQPEFKQWSELIQEFLEKRSINSSAFALRMTLTGGAPQSDIPSLFLFHTRPIPYTEKRYTEGIVLSSLKNYRNENSFLTTVKSTNYLENLLAKNEAQRQEADEGLWLNTKGYLAECTMSNLFFVKNGNLYTPSLNCGCLPGTRRQIVLELASTHHIPAFEGEYTSHDLTNADEVFVTNSLMGIMPVKKIDTSAYLSKFKTDKSVTRFLMNSYYSLINYS